MADERGFDRIKHSLSSIYPPDLILVLVVALACLIYPAQIASIHWILVIIVLILIYKLLAYGKIRLFMGNLFERLRWRKREPDKTPPLPDLTDLSTDVVVKPGDTTETVPEDLIWARDFLRSFTYLNASEEAMQMFYRAYDIYWNSFSSEEQQAIGQLSELKLEQMQAALDRQLAKYSSFPSTARLIQPGSSPNISSKI